jgi:hypothetical protein
LTDYNCSFVFQDGRLCLAKVALISFQFFVFWHCAVPSGLRCAPSVSSAIAQFVRHRRFDTPALNERLAPEDARDVVTKVWDRAGALRFALGESLRRVLTAQDAWGGCAAAWGKPPHETRRLPERRAPTPGSY